MSRGFSISASREVIECNSRVQDLLALATRRESDAVANIVVASKKCYGPYSQRGSDSWSEVLWVPKDDLIEEWMHGRTALSTARQALIFNQPRHRPPRFYRHRQPWERGLSKFQICGKHICMAINWEQEVTLDMFRTTNELPGGPCSMPPSHNIQEQLFRQILEELPSFVHERSDTSKIGSSDEVARLRLEHPRLLPVICV